ncbi:hypothetical protein CEP51_014435 [Fusarium floridanum]|uniref:Uncharacterized protein n=1 Tax=Fusarium floridanum TaxID=1325733 RepID=A0A428PSY1_9HYPO|nr:hypothetical protein CEP51_014435 [Fusarium floridanum]
MSAQDPTNTEALACAVRPFFALADQGNVLGSPSAGQLYGARLLLTYLASAAADHSIRGRCISPSILLADTYVRQTPMQSPPRFPSSTSTSQLDESRLPKGQCRYVLMIPELRGQRCGCVGFVHNKSLPGATCHCGHLPCFHTSSADASSFIEDRSKVDIIMQRIRRLTESLNRNSHGRSPRVISRIDELEAAVEKNKEDVSAEVRGSYRNASAAWRLVSQLQQTVKRLEETIQLHDEQMTKTGMQVDDLINRQLQLSDRGVMMEEKIEKLERIGPLLSPLQRRDPKRYGAPFEPMPTPITNRHHQHSTANHRSLTS